MVAASALQPRGKQGKLGWRAGADSRSSASVFAAVAARKRERDREQEREREAVIARCLQTDAPPELETKTSGRTRRAGGAAGEMQVGNGDDGLGKDSAGWEGLGELAAPRQSALGKRGRPEGNGSDREQTATAETAGGTLALGSELAGQERQERGGVRGESGSASGARSQMASALLGAAAAEGCARGAEEESAVRGGGEGSVGVGGGGNDGGGGDAVEAGGSGQVQPDRSEARDAVQRQIKPMPGGQSLWEGVHEEGRWNGEEGDGREAQADGGARLKGLMDLEAMLESWDNPVVGAYGWGSSHRILRCVPGSQT
jgi:hypothetical protein